MHEAARMFRCHHVPVEKFLIPGPTTVDRPHKVGKTRKEDGKRSKWRDGFETERQRSGQDRCSETTLLQDMKLAFSHWAGRNEQGRQSPVDKVISDFDRQGGVHPPVPATGIHDTI